MKKRYLIICALLSACSAHTRPYSDTLEMWVGQPEYVLQQTWGAPNNEFYVTPEEKVVTYISYSNQAVDGNKEPYAGYEVYYPAISTQNFGFPNDSSDNFYYCKTSFTIQNGVIVDYSFNGDDCVSPS